MRQKLNTIRGGWDKRLIVNCITIFLSGLLLSMQGNYLYTGPLFSFWAASGSANCQ